MINPKVSDDVMEIYRTQKLRSAFHWVFYEFVDPDTEELVVTHQCAKNEEWDWDTFVEQIQQGGPEAKSDDETPRYATVFFRFNADDRPQEKFCLVSWVPPTNRRLDFLYATALNPLKNKFDGIQKTIEAHEAADLDFDAVKAKCLE